jgi:cell division protein ZapE
MLSHKSIADSCLAFFYPLGPIGPVKIYAENNAMSLSSKSHMSPADRYRLDIVKGRLLPDLAQERVVLHFQRLYEEINARESARFGQFGRLKAKLGWSRSNPIIKGLYIYGGVGRGKTHLMDLFFESLPVRRKMRTHFHRFMQRVHKELGALRHQKNPLELVAANIAAEALVLCFDEFFVSDIGDAMILGGLLAHLTEQGVIIVTTSNIEPGRLYENGLQRERFLPAIALLQQHAEIVQIDQGVDYRLRSLQQARLYHSPLGCDADMELLRSFDSLMPDHAELELEGRIEVLGRQIPYRRCADDIIWFDFETLCGGPRSVYDYIELAKLYHAVLLSNIPRMDGDKDDMARRFVNLVDEFYDRGVKLIISAEVPLLELYAGSNLRFVFERTCSRLLEMQSNDYLAREHRP